MSKHVKIEKIGDFYVKYKIDLNKCFKNRKDRRKYEKKQLHKALRKGHILADPCWIKIKHDNERKRDNELKQYYEHHECPICRQWKTIDKFYIKDDCGHELCKNCFNELLMTKINERDLARLRCPVKDCSIHITADEIGKWIGGSKLFDKYEKISMEEEIADVVNFVFCPVSGCNNGMIINEYNHIRCDDCGFDFCVKCRKAYHENKTCEEFKEIQTDIRTNVHKIRKLIKKRKITFV